MKKYRFNNLALIEDIYKDKRNIEDIARLLGMRPDILLHYRRGECPIYKHLRAMARYFKQPMTRYIVKSRRKK